MLSSKSVFAAGTFPLFLFLYSVFPLIPFSLSNPWHTTFYSIVFIHDITEGREETWKTKNANELWPVELLRNVVPTPRILAYGYDASAVTKMSDILSPQRLKRCAKDLLREFPLCQDTQGEDRTRDRPIVFVAHGFGGLIYEQVCLSRATSLQRHPRPTDLEDIPGSCTLTGAEGR